VRSSQKLDHVLIIGASISGLLAAHVLADSFGHVTVIERDTVAEQPLPRKGVPQSTHVHVLLRRGLLNLERLFPGFTDDLAQAGASEVDWTLDVSATTSAGHGPRFPSGFLVRTCSRGLVEHLVYCRLAANPKVTFLQQTIATGLKASADRRTVTGVTLQGRGQGAGPDGSPPDLDADLVLDASGRTSHAQEWLEKLGYARPEETIINAFLGYASRVYSPPPDFNPGWKILLVRETPPFGTRGGVIYPIEGGRWMVNVAGAGEQRPPVDEEGFLEFIRSLSQPEFYDAVRQATPLSQIYGYQRTENRFCHFERMPDWPAGFLAMGDAVCAFNPVYGQGMSMATIEALALAEWLKGPAPELAFQKALAKAAAPAWLMATGEDSRIPGTEGARQHWTDRLVYPYLQVVEALSMADPVVYKDYVQALHLMAPPSILFRPATFLKVIRKLVEQH
jgi:2-polyprenyl-6-methoxyphenol hydroxylase-like FAD-dependent oxidoreductase